MGRQCNCHPNKLLGDFFNGLQRAGDGIRTHDNDVGNVVLYQLSYTRMEFRPPQGQTQRKPHQSAARTFPCCALWRIPKL